LDSDVGEDQQMSAFRLEGEYWTIEYEGAVIRLHDAKGLQYLAYLLHRPGQQFTALDLARRLAVEAGSPDVPGGSGEAEAERARSAVGKRLRAGLAKIHHSHPPLGRYLTVCVQVGRVCAYVPDPREPVTWSE
jgi:hypothetical protein